MRNGMYVHMYVPMCKKPWILLTTMLMYSKQCGIQRHRVCALNTSPVAYDSGPSTHIIIGLS